MSLWKVINGYWSKGGSTGTDKARIDGSTNSLQVIDYSHHEIHNGSNFIVRSYVDLAINNVLDIQITTPDTTKWAHMILLFECESETNFWVYENVAISTAGTAITPGNRNRNSGNSSVLTLAEITNTSIANANADTAIAGATLLADGIIGSGKDQGFTGSREEVIFKQNEDYSIRFEASTAGYVNFQLDWYEHTDLN